MAASVWFAVTTRGLEMILPLPSDSRALSSKFRKRVMPALNSDKANDPGCAFVVVRVAGKFTDIKSLGFCGWGTVAVVVIPGTVGNSGCPVIQPVLTVLPPV